MTIQRMDHVGIVVDELAAATAFFVELGLELEGKGSVEGDRVDRIVGLEGVRSDFAMMETPDGHIGSATSEARRDHRRAGGANPLRARPAWI